jgi:hypothetical protein
MARSTPLLSLFTATALLLANGASATLDPIVIKVRGLNAIAQMAPLTLILGFQVLL